MTGQPVRTLLRTATPQPSIAAIEDAVRAAITKAVDDARPDSSCRCEDDGVTCTDDWFDRSVCPEPCGSMHTICTECGRVKGFCPLAFDGRERRRRDVALAVAVLSEHAPDDTYRGARHPLYCHGCLEPDLHASEVPWPCPTAALAASTLGVDPGVVGEPEGLQALVALTFTTHHPQPVDPEENP